MTQREMMRQATLLLRKAGCTWSGRKRGEVKGKQAAFERQMIPTGFRGASRPTK